MPPQISSMDFLTLLFVAIGLSFDTFAVSISTGIIVNEIKFWQGVRVAIIMALFQTVMPLIGIFLGLQVSEYISEYDHWLAFGLLTLLGAKMIIDSFKEEEEKEMQNPLKLTNVIGMSVATSIDALAVGVIFAGLNMNISLMAFVVGSVTFLVAMIGMLLGKRAGAHLGSKLDIIGALILIGVGLKILLEHLQII